MSFYREMWVVLLFVHLTDFDTKIIMVQITIVFKIDWWKLSLKYLIVLFLSKFKKKKKQ